MTLTFVAIASLLMDYTLAVCQWQVEVARQDKPFTRSAFVQDRQPLVSMSEFLSNISVANMGSSDAMVRILGHLNFRGDYHYDQSRPLQWLCMELMDSHPVTAHERWPLIRYSQRACKCNWVLRVHIVTNRGLLYDHGHSSHFFFFN